MKKINFLVKSKDEVYRLFSVIHELDHRNEPYLKIVVPSIKTQNASLLEMDSYILPIDQDGLFSKAGESQINCVHELSFHYETGVMHFKNFKNEYIGQKKDLANIRDRPFLLASRLVFNDLEKAAKYKKMIKEDSIVLNLPFNRLGRLFEVYLTTVNLRFENSEFERIPQIGSHVLDIQNSDVHIVVNEYCYFREELVPENISFSWFLPNKQTS